MAHAPAPAPPPQAQAFVDRSGPGARFYFRAEDAASRGQSWVRSFILERVDREPGVLPSRLAEELHLTLNTVLYHVRVLRRVGLVRIGTVGPARLLFPVRFSAAEQRTHMSLRAPLARRVLELAQSGQRWTIAAAAASLGVTPRAVRVHVRRLAECGVLDCPTGVRSAGFRAVPAEAPPALAAATFGARPVGVPSA